MPLRLWAHCLIITTGVRALEYGTAQMLKSATYLRVVSPPSLDRSFPDRWCQCNWRGDLLKYVLFLAEKTFPRTLKNWGWKCRLGQPYWRAIRQYLVKLSAYTLRPSQTSLESTPPKNSGTGPLKDMYKGIQWSTRYRNYNDDDDDDS